jgi:uncharacterized membrane protein (DUF485 family)
MQDDAGVDKRLTADEAEKLMHRVMWRQARLSLSVAAVFISLLVVIPLINLFAPSLAGTPVAGFTLSWLVLGVLFYPVTWALSAYFVKRSNDLEADIAKEQTN